MARRLIKKQGGWLSFKGGGGRRQIVLNVSSIQSTVYNIYTNAGSPLDVVDVILTLNSACQQGIDTGSGWVSGSTITIINKSTISGIGGSPGGGGAVVFSGSVAGSAGLGNDGSAGVFMQFDVSIDNGSGQINGGGGGGGGGGAVSQNNPPLDNNTQAAGGGGGGGQGFNNASGGAHGFTAAIAGNGHDGSSGSSSGPGAGGAGGIDGTGFNNGGTGGTGGTWGQPGATGGNPNNHGSGFCNGAPGGRAGASVATNGHTLIWIAGSGNILGPIT